MPAPRAVSLIPRPHPLPSPLFLSPAPFCQVSFLRLCNHVYAIADNNVVGFGRQHHHHQRGQQTQPLGGVEEESESQREAIDKALEEVKR